MLNPFPQLLVFGFFAPTLLRLAVGVCMFIAAYRLFNRHQDDKLMWPLVLLHAILGFMLVTGYYTQIAALLAGVGSFGGLFVRKYSVFPRSALLLLAVICASLLVTGAGALGFDIPL